MNVAHINQQRPRATRPADKMTAILLRPYAALIVEPTNARVRAEIERQAPGFPAAQPRQVYHLVAFPDGYQQLCTSVMSFMISEHTARRAGQLVNEHFMVIAPLTREIARLREAHGGEIPPRLACEFLRLAEGVLTSAEERLQARRKADSLTPTLCPYARFDARHELGALASLVVAPADAGSRSEAASQVAQ